jgi:hypothetical protein
VVAGGGVVTAGAALTAPPVAGAAVVGCGVAGGGGAKVGGTTLVPAVDSVSPTAAVPVVPSDTGVEVTFGIVDTVAVGATAAAPALPASGSPVVGETAPALVGAGTPVGFTIADGPPPIDGGGAVAPTTDDAFGAVALGSVTAGGCDGVGAAPSDGAGWVGARVGVCAPAPAALDRTPKNAAIASHLTSINVCPDCGRRKAPTPALCFCLF